MKEVQCQIRWIISKWTIFSVFFSWYLIALTSILFIEWKHHLHFSTALSPPCSWPRLVTRCQWGEDTWQQLAAPVWTVSSQTVPLYCHLYRVIDVKPGTSSSSSSQCPDRMQSQEDHQRSWESRPERRKRCGGGRRMVSWDGWRVRTLLHKWSNSYTTPHQTPDILIGASQSRSTAGSRSQAQARVMSSSWCNPICNQESRI